MVRGTVRSTGSPVVPIEVAGRPFEAVVDTGFEGGLQLPDVLIPLVNPVHVGHQRYQYPDGSIGLEPIFEVQVVFDGETVSLPTKFSESDEVMLGVDALKDYRLEIDFAACTVLIERVRP